MLWWWKQEEDVSVARWWPLLYNIITTIVLPLAFEYHVAKRNILHSHIMYIYICVYFVCTLIGIIYVFNRKSYKQIDHATDLGPNTYFRTGSFWYSSLVSLYLKLSQNDHTNNKFFFLLIVYQFCSRL